MGSKRFHTRRYWHNALLMAWMVPLLLLLGVLVFAATGKLLPLMFLGGLSIIGIVVALVRDMGNHCTYQLVNGNLVFTSDGHTMEVPITEVSDASLVDRAAARDYIRTKLAREGIVDRGQVRERMRRFVRYCSVDIGMTTLTLGFGRSLIDRLPNAKHDLVLLRLRNGEDLLLSPQYNQDLVDSINQRAYHIGRGGTRPLAMGA